MKPKYPYVIFILALFTSINAYTQQEAISRPLPSVRQFIYMIPPRSNPNPSVREKPVFKGSVRRLWINRERVYYKRKKVIKPKWYE